MDYILEIRKRLTKLSEEKYKQFSSSLIPQNVNMLGVRLPILRKLAQEIAKKDWQIYLSFEPQYFEEKMLQAFIIGLIDIPVNERLKIITKFVRKIDNWSICDSFCCSLKFTFQNKDLVWTFLQKYLYSAKEFEQRFGFVMLLNFYIEKDYLKEIFNCVNNFKNNKYYAQMACAWLISMCYIKFKTETLKFLKTTKLDNYTYNLTLQKIIESNKVPQTEKNNFRKMKYKL